MADLFGINEPVNSMLEPLLDPNIRPVLMLFLAVYGGLAAPGLPPQLHSFLSNIYARVIFLALIVWIANKDPGVAIAAAVAFIGIVNLSSNKGVFEMFSTIESFEGPTTAIYPGCLNMKVYDLLESFNNNKDALLQAMLVARVPGNIQLNDYFAPLISTYLLNRGFALKSPCSPPGTGQTIGF